MPQPRNAGRSQPDATLPRSAQQHVRGAATRNLRRKVRPANAPSGHTGQLIEARIPYELGGQGRLAITPSGAHAYIAFPLDEGDSILETDAPQRALVFGGAIDMRDAPDLAGRPVLIMEDDFYLATDLARAFQGAGARVLGPCRSETAARREIETLKVAGGVIDINLGRGPSFGIAAYLKAIGVPFLFVTGYDEEAIPQEFADVRRLQKPIDFREVVGALAELLDA